MCIIGFLFGVCVCVVIVGYPYSSFTHLALPPGFTFPLIPEEHTLPISLSDHCGLLVL